MLVAGFPPLRPGFEPRSGHVWFVGDKVALGQVSSEYFSFHQMIHTHLSSGSGTIGQLVADVPSGLSLKPPHKIKKKRCFSVMTCFGMLWRLQDLKLIIVVMFTYADRLTSYVTPVLLDPAVWNHKFIRSSVALQPSVGPWMLFQFRKPTHSL
jgi:hypothetical protein